MDAVVFVGWLFRAIWVGSGHLSTSDRFAAEKFRGLGYETQGFVDFNASQRQRLRTETRIYQVRQLQPGFGSLFLRDSLNVARGMQRLGIDLWSKNGSPRRGSDLRYKIETIGCRIKPPWIGGALLWQNSLNESVKGSSHVTSCFYSNSIKFNGFVL